MNDQTLPKWLSESFILALVLAPLAYLLSVWSSLPETIPLHYNMANEVDRYGAKKELWIPVIMVTLPIYFILLVVPLVEQKERRDAKWKQSFYRLRLFMQACLSGVASLIVYHTQTPGGFDPSLGFGVVFCLLFTGFWLLMPADGPGNALSIRTPWTQNNPAIELQTRKFTRAFWGFGGLLGIPLVILAPATAQLPFSLIWMIVLVVSPVIYSWNISRQNSQRIPTAQREPTDRTRRAN